MALLCGSASIPTLNAVTVTTDPVGAITLDIPGNGGSGQRLSVVGFPLTSSVEFAGSLTSVTLDPGQDSVLNVTGGNWTTNDINTPGGFAQFNWDNEPLFYIILKSGDHQGLLLDVIATEAPADSASGLHTLVVEDLSSLSPALTGSESFEIRAANTLETLFGSDNSVGFKTGQTNSEADVLYILNGAGQFIQHYYQIDQFGGFGGGDGWRRAGDSISDASSTRISPEDGVIIARKENSALPLINSGDVNMGAALTTIRSGYNTISYRFPLDTTLGESGLWISESEGIQGGQNSSEADIVYIVNENTGQFELYYYQIDQFGGFGGGDGWRVSGDSINSQATKEIKAGTAVIVFRRGVTSAEWAMSQPF